MRKRKEKRIPERKEGERERERGEEETEREKLTRPRSWDDLYNTEIANHASNPADEGTVWFDDADAEMQMVDFLGSHAYGLGKGGYEAEGDEDDGLYRIDGSTASIIDLGCGNGSLLFALRDAGWAGRLLGVDYSERSIALARQIQGARAAGLGDEDDDEDDEYESREEREEEGKEEEEDEGKQEGDKDDGAGKIENTPVDFLAWDVLNGPLEKVSTCSSRDDGSAGWDIVLDKGTFDAISLSGDRDGAGRRISEGYRSRALQLLRPGGIFLITSCNWTEAELNEWFAPPAHGDGAEATEGRFYELGKVIYRTFSFGGAKGQAISTMCFRKYDLASS